MASRQARRGCLRLSGAHLDRGVVLHGTHVRPPKGLPAEMYATRAGVFVSVKKFGELRGCIGTIMPARASIAEEICANARAAAAHDPRFRA